LRDTFFLSHIPGLTRGVQLSEPGALHIILAGLAKRGRLSVEGLSGQEPWEPPQPLRNTVRREGQEVNGGVLEITSGNGAEIFRWKMVWMIVAMMLSRRRRAALPSRSQRTISTRSLMVPQFLPKHVLHTAASFGVHDSAQEAVITRDIHRTFPAHDYFKDSDGEGQDSLYKICKAYSVYDDEIGYCPGQSFLAAVLLLHMPEEQAFCVLVKIMYDYGLRALYRNNFEDLHCKFYQLERLMQEQLQDLWSHFQALNLEAHMYASQWFLTLFTAKFPLCMVFHITDLLLCEGMNIIFNVALALLKVGPYFIV
ncbi:Rab GTPase-activating protein 1-like, partial [Takifugu flavidus]